MTISRNTEFRDTPTEFRDMGSLFREITILISQQFRENSANEISLEPYKGRTSTGAEANTKETISTFNVKPI